MKRFGTAWTVFCLFSLSFFIIATASTCLSAEEQAASQAGQEQAESVRDDTETSETAEADTEETEPDTAGQKLETKEIGEETAGIKTMTVSAPEEDTFSQPIEVPAAENITPVGVLSYRIPVKVPRGRMGIEPDIAFVYKSYLKNGWLGVGWDLDMGSIRRSVKRGLDYGGDDFVYVRDGVKTELADRSNEWGSGYYGARIEEDFSRFRFDRQNNTWIRTTKDGTKYYYGRNSGSRQESADGVFGWHLDRIEDTNQSAVTVTYVKDRGQIYLSEITYPGGGGDKRIAFILEGREDVGISFTTHSGVKTARRLSRVETFTGTQPILTYRLTYGRGTSGVHSRLTGIQEWAPEGPSEIALPPYTFTCQEGGDGRFDLSNAKPVTPRPGHDTYPDEESFHAMELNGDGRADVVSDSARWLSNGDGTFTRVEGGLHDFRVYRPDLLGDVNGDGLTDLVSYVHYSDYDEWDGGSSCEWKKVVVTVYLSNGNGFDRGIRTNMGNFPYAERTFLMIEANGDGYADLLMFGRGCAIYLSNGDGTFQTTRFNQGPLYCYAPIDLSRTGDINGDGLTDLMQFRCDYEEFDGQINYLGIKGRTYLATGRGFSEGILSFESSSSSGTPSLADVNGDGLADLTTPGGIYLSRGDGTFEDSMFGPGVMVGGHSLLADFTGDGLNDILNYSSIDPGYVHPPSYELTLYPATGGGCPDLLTKIENPYGATATVEYTPSTQYNNNALPFPLYVVSSLEIDPGVGVHSTTTYDYEGGLFDPDDRAFWGFEKVTKTNPDGTVEEITYHQDLYRRGRPLQVTITEPGGISPFSVTSNTWETSPANPPQDGWAFVKRTRERTDLYDDQQVYMQSDYTYDDDNGNLLSIERSGTSGPRVTEEKEYVNKQSSRDGWLWRTARESLKNDQGTTVREVSCTYDDNGNKLTEKRYLDGVDDPVITMTCDAWGNMLTEQDALGNVTTMVTLPPKTRPFSN